jgi:hypothetical protein
MPKATVSVHCEACGANIGELDINTFQLASEISRLRREHAIKQHQWAAASVR